MNLKLIRTYYKNTILLGTILALTISSCGGGGSNLTVAALGSLFQAAPDYTDVLRYSGEKIILPSLQNLKDDTILLETAATTYYATQSTSNLTALQNAWKQARSSLKRVETFYFGPADLPSTASYYTKMDGFEKNASRPQWLYVNQVINGAGGAGGNTCATVTMTSAALASCATRTKGFEALEMLIFSADGDATTIDSLSSINSANTGRRLDYLKALSELIRQDAGSLYTQWSPAGGNFLENFVVGNGIYFRNQGQAFDVFVQAVGNLVNQMEETKLGVPSCLSASCTTNPVSDVSETIFSRNAYQDLYDNVLGIEFAYIGTVSDPDVKTLSILVETQNPQLDADIKTAISDLKTALNAKIASNDDLYAEIASDGGVKLSNGSVVNNVKPIWLLAQNLKNFFSVDAFGVLGVAILPSSNDGD